MGYLFLMRMLKRFLILSFCLALAAAAYQRLRTDQLMVQAAQAYLASLHPDQVKLGVFKLDDELERTHWLYTPFERNGLTLRQMAPEQRHLAEALLSNQPSSGVCLQQNSRLSRLQKKASEP